MFIMLAQVANWRNFTILPLCRNGLSHTKTAFLKTLNSISCTFKVYKFFFGTHWHNFSNGRLATEEMQQSCKRSMRPNIVQTCSCHYQRDLWALQTIFQDDARAIAFAEANLVFSLLTAFLFNCGSNKHFERNKDTAANKEAWGQTSMSRRGQDARLPLIQEENDHDAQKAYSKICKKCHSFRVNFLILRFLSCRRKTT